jgi:signal transduction histidine kinase
MADMNRIRLSLALFWPPKPGESFAAADAFPVRPLLFLSVWLLVRHWFAFFAPHAGALVLATWGLDVVLWAGLRRMPRVSQTVVPLVNAAFWSTLAFDTGCGRSPFLVGYFLEIALAAFRLSPVFSAATTLAGALGLAVIAGMDPGREGASLAATASVCVLVTGGSFVYMVGRLRRGRDDDQQRTAYVAHGVKNSLHGVAGFAALLATDLAPEDPRREFTQYIRTGLEEANSRLQELMSPGSQRHGSDDRSCSELRSCVEGALETCRGVLEGGNVRAILEVPPDVHGRIEPEALRTVLVNLIHNAVEAMQPGGGLLRLDGSADPPVLRVHDSGPGIPAAIRDRIFEPHYTTRAEGHGLGLSEARDTLRRFGGDIRTRSEPGQGTLFELVMQPPNGR